MTVINGIEIDYITYKKNPIREAILNNDPIEDKLHVIAVVSNPSLFAKRYILMKEFIARMENDEPDVILYVVELAYGNQRFLITDKKNKRHLKGAILAILFFYYKSSNHQKSPRSTRWFPY